MKFLLLIWAVVSLLQGLNSVQWSSTSPQNGDVKYVCKGGSVMLPWKYILSSGDVLGDIKWYYNGNSQELIAMFSVPNFLPLPAFANRVQFVDNAGITVSHLTVSDSGNYSVEINIYEDSGTTRTVLQRSATVQINDHLMTQDGSLHAIQKSEPVLDTTSDQWAIQLQCGVFTFLGDPPFQVEWITPSGVVVNSSDYSLDNHFNLLLTNPIQGGNYTCRVPPQHIAEACLHGNGAGHSQASVHVDKVDTRLSLLEKENEQLKRELKQSHLNLSQVQSLEQVKVADLQNRVEGLEDRTHKQIWFHAIHLQSQTPPLSTPLIVNNVYYNYGNAYNGTTGYFTALYPGVYFFAGTTGSDHNDHEALHDLCVNGNVISHVHSNRDDNGGIGVGTVHAVVHLTKGVRVWVRSEGHIYRSEVTSFSGFLISPDP